MTVKKLITLLQKCDPTKEVIAEPDAMKPVSDILGVEDGEVISILYQYIQD